MGRQTNLLTVCVLSIYTGIIYGCNARQVRSLAQTVARKDPGASSQLHNNILELIERLHALSENKVKSGPSFQSGNPPDIQVSGQPMSRVSETTSRMSGEIDFTSFYGVLSGIFAVYGPLIKNRFVENLPKTIVCILSERQDCGLEAELTRAISLELAKPFFEHLLSVTSQTCSSGSAEPRSLLNYYLQMGDTNTTSSFHQMFITALSELPLSGGLLSALSAFMDTTFPPIVTYFSDFMQTFIQTPMDYVKLGLQLGIRIPSIDQTGWCQQGDLKQLIIWGMSHNVTWAFGNAILDIFLAPVPALCYPGPNCQSHPDVTFSRSLESIIASDPLSCDSHTLAKFNDTSCPDIIKMGQQGLDLGFNSLQTFCQALSTLSSAQLEQVWSTSCHMVMRVTMPLLQRASCILEAPPTSQPHLTPSRVAREAVNLNSLACNYGNWSGSGQVDAGLVTLCSDNDSEQFVSRVCQNASMMKKLLLNPENSWLWGYCSNSTQNYVVSQFCRYDVWQAEGEVDPSLVGFCWEQDQTRFKALLCEDLNFFLVLYSNPANNWLQPNCTMAPPPLDINTLVTEECNYARWKDVTHITMDTVSLCVQYDPQGFIYIVCSNATFLAALLHNPGIDWVNDYCALNMNAPHTDPPPLFSIQDWCNYQLWGQLMIDPSLVGLCWQHDQLNFSKNVCCNMPLFEKLTLDPQNSWLMSVCSEQENSLLISQLCHYADWTQPIIVDMTDLAFCAELDSRNFTYWVCSNRTVLENLLANLDNTWLLQHCANQTGGGGGPEGGLLGFRPVVQCQYKSWSISIPDQALLALCWDYDQANFVSSICPDAGLVAKLIREPSAIWVGKLCATYTNYTSVNSSSTVGVGPGVGAGAGTGAGTEGGSSQSCLVRDIVLRFNWTCSADLTPACTPGASPALALQMLLRCGVEALSPHLHSVLPQSGQWLMGQAATVTVVILVAMEENRMTSLPVTENIRLSVLEDVVLYMERENNLENKRVLLQCFGKVLTSLMQTGRDVTSDGFFHIKEYFKIPLASLTEVLRAVDISTVRQILQYFNRNRDALKLSEAYLSTMVSVLFQTHFSRDPSLFPELAPLLVLASPADIQAFPSLQDNLNVKAIINYNLGHLSSEQRWAFGRWYSQALGPGNITTGGLTVVRDIGNLITYVPFILFQLLSPAQLLDGLDVLLRNPLNLLQQQFVAQSVFGTFRNLTALQIYRLGNLSCLAEPPNLLLYQGSEAFSVIRDNIRSCIIHGVSLPSNMISSMFLNTSDLQSPWSLSSVRLSQLAHFLPWLGIDFLQQLNQSQLTLSLPALSAVTFSPAEAAVIVDKLASNTLSVPGGLQQLGSLLSGVKVETLQSLTSNTLLSSLPAMLLHSHRLSPSQANAVASKLWGSVNVQVWLDQLEPLLPSTPLLSLLPQTRPLMTSNSSTNTRPWNTQQAQALFQELMNIKSYLSPQAFLSLGTISTGASCKVLKKLFFSQPSSSSLRSLLVSLREQPVPLHTSLTKCVIDELYKLDVFSDLLEELGAEMALAMTVSTIKKFPSDMMNILRKMIVQEPHHFLKLPRTKQDLLVDKMVQTLEMYTGQYTQAEFQALGVMATSVVDEMFVQLDRRFLVDSLELLRSFCYSHTKRELMAMMLQEPTIFGPVQNWTTAVLNQVDRFIFFLPTDKLKLLPPALLTQGRIERLFQSQQRWEGEEFGSLCMAGRDQEEKTTLFNRQQFLLQYFLGFLTLGRLTALPPVPSCENLKSTAPSAWSTDSLLGMSRDAFTSCLELIGQDPFLSPYQLTVLLKKTKQVYGAVSSFPPNVVSRLGRLALQLTVEELGALRLSELSSIAALGAVSTWSTRQLPALYSSLLNSTKLSPSQLDSSTLVAMGHIICGISSTEMRKLNAVQFSKAVLWLGHLRLACSEEQLVSLVDLLSHNLAFGIISSWGSQVFIEIGALAAGIPDMAMSALVKEQIEGLSPLAVSLIPPQKFAVVFNQAQINMFSYEQAMAVTSEQRALLSDVQLTALSMVLTPWENRPLDFRDRSSGLIPISNPLCYLLGVLMLLLWLV